MSSLNSVKKTAGETIRGLWVYVEEEEDEKEEQIDQNKKQSRWKDMKNWRDRSRLGGGAWDRWTGLGGGVYVS